MGDVLIQCDVKDHNMTFVIIDSGRPFDPLKKPDPDVNVSLLNRSIGGLGIYLTKKTMDGVSYEYADGRNILTFTKKLTDLVSI